MEANDYAQLLVDVPDDWLTLRQRTALEHCAAGLDYKTIAKRYDVSQERVRQIVAKAIKKVKERRLIQQ